MDKEYNKRKYTIYIIFVLLFILSFLIYNLRFSNKENKEINNEKKVLILSDYSRFFTVNSCIYKYITYLQNKDINNILKVLDKEYLVSNNINSDNVLNFVENLNGNYSFVSKKIYYEKLDNNYIKYYVYGNLVQDTIDGIGNSVDRYYIVLFDVNNQLFSITPYNEFSFKEVSNEN